MKNSVEPRESRFNLTGLKTVDGCHGSCRFSDSEFFYLFFFFLGTYSSAIDEASTSDIEIAPLFVLILLLNLARPLSCCIFADCCFAFSLSLRFFCLLFLQFSPSLHFSFPLQSHLVSLKMIDSLLSVNHSFLNFIGLYSLFNQFCKALRVHLDRTYFVEIEN